MNDICCVMGACMRDMGDRVELQEINDGLRLTMTLSKRFKDNKYHSYNFIIYSLFFLTFYPHIFKILYILINIFIMLYILLPYFYHIAQQFTLVKVWPNNLVFSLASASCTQQKCWCT